MQHSLELPAVTIKNAFAGLSKVISSKSTLPVLGCIRVEADANGDAQFQVTDLDSFATGHVQATSPGRFPACLIPFERLEENRKQGKLQFYGVATWNGFREHADSGKHHSLVRMVSSASQPARCT